MTNKENIQSMQTNSGKAKHIPNKSSRHSIMSTRATKHKE